MLCPPLAGMPLTHTSTCRGQWGAASGHGRPGSREPSGTQPGSPLTQPGRTALLPTPEGCSGTQLLGPSSPRPGSPPAARGLTIEIRPMRREDVIQDDVERRDHQLPVVVTVHCHEGHLQQEAQRRPWLAVPTEAPRAASRHTQDLGFRPRRRLSYGQPALQPLTLPPFPSTTLSPSSSSKPWARPFDVSTRLHPTCFAVPPSADRSAPAAPASHHHGLRPPLAASTKPPLLSSPSGPRLPAPATAEGNTPHNPLRTLTRNTSRATTDHLRKLFQRRFRTRKSKAMGSLGGGARGRFSSPVPWGDSLPFPTKQQRPFKSLLERLPFPEPPGGFCPGQPTFHRLNCFPQTQGSFSSHCLFTTGQTAVSSGQ